MRPSAASVPRPDDLPEPARVRRGLAALAMTFAALGLGAVPAEAARTAPATQAGGLDADDGGTGTAAGATGSTGASGSTGAPSGPAAGAGVAVTLTKAQARRVQKTLRVRADGAFGAKSRSALKRWERRQGLPADGLPDSEALRRMGITLTATQKQAIAASAKVPAGATGASGATGATAVPGASAAGQTAVQAAMGQVGQPYRSAGTGAGGFDCSGLTQFAFAKAGVDLPHSSFDQFTLGQPVAQDQIQAGDLVFFDSAGPGASDVGIATSPTETVSATTKGVKVHATFDAYWGGHFVGARRVG